MVTIKVISEQGVEDKKIPQGFEDVQWCDYVEALCANALCVDDYTPVYSILTGIDAEDFELMSTIANGRGSCLRVFLEIRATVY